MNIYLHDLDNLIKQELKDTVKWYIDELSLHTPQMKENIIRSVKDITEAGI